MKKFAVRFDCEDRQFIVVRWDNPKTADIGGIVYRTFVQEDANDWAQCAEEEENLAIYNEFG